MIFGKPATAHKSVSEALGIGAFFAVVAIALLGAAAFNAPLSWDGAYYLFKALDLQEPFVSTNRLINAVLQQPVLWASRVTSDLETLRVVFGAAYVTVPLLSLACAAWLCRARPGLFRWAALGICVASLPGRLFFVAESTMASDLFWPVLLGVLVAVPGRLDVALLILLGGLLALTHPIAAPMLVVAALLAVARAFRSTGRRGVWAVLAAAFAAFAMVQSTLPLTGYEVESASAQRMVEAFQTSVLGKPLLAELLIAAAAGLWLARSHLRGARVRFERLADGGAMVAVGTAGAILVVWAARPEQWAMALDFHFWQAPIGLCLALGATADALTSARRDRLVSPAVLTCGLVFCAVLLVQVWTWTMTSSQLRTELLGEGAPCTTIQRVAAAPGRSVLDHWSTAAYALVLQSRAPTRFVLADEAACQRLITSGSLWFAAWDVRPPKSGWFALRP